MSSDTMKLALQITAVDMLSGVLAGVQKKISSLGPAAQQVGKDFEQMSDHMTKSLKAMAVAHYGIEKIVKGIKPAADFQDAMLEYEMTLMRSSKNAEQLKKELAESSREARKISAMTLYDKSTSVRTMLKLEESGVEHKAVVEGAGMAAAQLGVVTKSSPDLAANALLSVGIPYHLEGAQYKEVADVLQKHILSGRLKLSDYETHFKYIIPAAQRMGMTWQETTSFLAMLGEQGLVNNAGIEGKDFLERMSGGSREERKIHAELNQKLVKKGKKPLEFYDKGNPRKLHDIINDLREIDKELTPQERAFVTEKMFGTRGGIAADASKRKGQGDLDYIEERAKQSASMAEKFEVRMRGLNAQMELFATNITNLKAEVFEPLLAPLTAVAKKMGETTDKVVDLAEQHKTLTKTAGYTAVGVVGGATAIAAYQAVKAAIAGGKVLKGLAGLGGTAMGIGEGKAIQAATGVQPVFVVNMPGGFGNFSASSVVGGAAEVAAGAASATALTKSFASAFAAATPWLATAIVSGLGGYILGSGINRGLAKLSGWLTNGKYSSDGWLGEMVYDAQEKYPGKLGSMISGEKQKNEIGSGWLADMGVGEKQKNEINMNITVDQQGRVTSSTDDPNTTANITTNRGSFTDPESYK